MTLILVVYYYQDLLAMSYDEEFAQIRGVPVKKLYFGLIGMLAITIVLVIQVVGLILVIALLTIPPFIVEKYANSLAQMMVASSLLGAVFTVCRPLAFVPLQSHIRRFDYHGFRYRLPDFSLVDKIRGNCPKIRRTS
jgi:ABC-type Mn2+/Zn2+ transport system permease subunit